MDELDDEFAAAEALLAAMESGSPLPPLLVKPSAILKRNVAPERIVVGSTVSFSRPNAIVDSFGMPGLRESHFLRDEHYRQDGLTGLVTRIEPGTRYTYVYVVTYWDRGANGDDLATTITYTLRIEHVKLNSNLITNDYVNHVRGMIEAQTVLEERKKAEEREKAEAKKKEQKRKEEEAIKSRKDELEAIAEEIHPGNWDFAEIAPGEFAISNARYRMMIHFPTAELTNSQRKKHKITDLYVSFFFNSALDHIGSIYGNRGSLSYAELTSGYRHSHLPATNSGWGHFCLGSDTPTSNLIGGLAADRWSPSAFRSMLTLLYTYIEWESLEGGPHFRMEALLERNQTSIRSVEPSYLKSYTNNFIKRYTEVPLSLENVNGFNVFKINRNDESFIKNITDIISVNHTCLKTVNGEFISRNSDNRERARVIEEFENNARRDNPDRKIFYKGKFVDIVCNKSDILEVDNSLIVPNPSITNHIADFLETELNNYQLKIEAYELSGR